MENYYYEKFIPSFIGGILRLLYDPLIELD